MKSKTIIFTLLSALILCGCNTKSNNETATSKPIEMATVKVDAGNLVGYHEDSIYAFKGVPYASAKRFEAPTAITSYKNEKQLALTYGTVSPQDRGLNGTGAINANEFMTPSNGTADMVMNEECQNLNVWTKDLKASKPVVVFFHGGGLSNGASSELSYYNGSYFVEREDVVFVSVNHRLNVLGYLDLSKYGEQYKDSGIVGIQDCVEALKWVQKNITQFGGDPKNVTILGQSGGGTKVSTLACMSDTVDLFDKVFLMSGGYSTSDSDKSAAEANTDLLVKYLKLNDSQVIDTVLKMDYENLFTAANSAGCKWETNYGIGTFESPLFDENGKMNKYASKRKWVVGTTYSEFSDNGNGMIYGQNPDNVLNSITDEIAMKKLEEKYGDKAKVFADEYKKAYPDHPLSESLFINSMPAGGLSRAACINDNNGLLKMMNNAGATVYNYVVSYKMPYFGGVTMHHTGDMPFWFNSLKEVEYLIKGDEKNAYDVSTVMADALGNFVKKGDPSTDSLKWKAYTEEEHNTMTFDTKSELKVNFDAELYSILMSAQKK